MATLGKVQVNSLGDAVAGFLIPAKVSEIASGIGFNSKANFTSSEYTCLLEQTTKIVLRHLEGSSYLPLQARSLRERVHPIVDEILRKECKCLSSEEPSLDIVPVFFLNWVASMLSKLTIRQP